MLLSTRIVYLSFIMSYAVCSMSNISHKLTINLSFDNKENNSSQAKKCFDSFLCELLKQVVAYFRMSHKQTQIIIPKQNQNENEFKSSYSLYRDLLQKETKKYEMEKYWRLRQG